MASPSTLTILLILLFSLQTHARDSQFFSKVTRNRDSATATTTTSPDTIEVSSLSSKEEQEEEAGFSREGTEIGYGLYGHETGVDPPSSASPSTLYTMDENKGKNYATQLKGLSLSGFTGEGSTMTKFKNNGVEMYYDQGSASHGGVEKQGINDEVNESVGYYGEEEKQGISAKNYYKHREVKGVGYYGGVEKQGMSDTRYMENGKYFYDINAENNFESHPNYIPYKGNHYNSNRGNNYNNYEESYGMHGYKNQAQEEEDFEFDP